MRSRMNWIVGSLILTICVTVFVVIFYFLSKNEIGRANQLKRSAKKEYYAHEYLKAYRLYDTLIDSLKVNEDPVSINYANAAFLSSEILTRKNYRGNIAAPKRDEPDSAFHALADKGIAEYFKLLNSPNKKIASMASNQIGFSAIKKGETLGDDKLDSLFAESLTHFKEALRKDPANDSARYNYELLKKIAGYPETVLSQTRALVAQKKYRQAAEFLESAMQRDRRLKKNTDVLQRIKTIIGIDTLKLRRI